MNLFCHLNLFIFNQALFIGFLKKRKLFLSLNNDKAGRTPLKVQFWKFFVYNSDHPTFLYLMRQNFATAIWWLLFLLTYLTAVRRRAANANIYSNLLKGNYWLRGFLRNFVVFSNLNFEENNRTVNINKKPFSSCLSLCFKRIPWYLILKWSWVVVARSIANVFIWESLHAPERFWNRGKKQLWIFYFTSANDAVMSDCPLRNDHFCCILHGSWY